jgi:ribosomal protein S18 acetylase RimI-like enzyme
MTTPTIEVIPLEAAQIDAAAGAMSRAFQPSPMFTYVFPDEVERTQRSPAFFVQLLRYGRRVGEVAATAGIPQGAIVSWTVPTDETALAAAPEDSLAAMPALLSEAAFARFIALVGHVDAHQDQLVPPPYWYVIALGVEPTAQGQGIGRALVQHHFAQAAATGLPAVLWTDTARNVRFYQGLGMRLVGEGLMPESPFPYWILRWDG